MRDEERTVTDIAKHFDVSRPAISQHLRVLSDADLVSVREQGTRRYYRARPEGLAELAEWLTEFWQTSLSQLSVEVERAEWNKRKRSADQKKGNQ